MLRRSGQLALQATLLLALEPHGGPRRIRELAAELGVASPYLTKIMQNLTRVGLVRAYRGPGGGVQLARPAHKIYPWDVLSAVDPVAEFSRCLLDVRPCSEVTPCPLHPAWAPARDRIRQVFQTKSLIEFAAEAQRDGVPFWMQTADAGGTSERLPRRAARETPNEG